MAGALCGAQRAGQMIVSKGNVGAVWRIERYLEEVEQIAIGAAEKAASRNCMSG